MTGLPFGWRNRPSYNETTEICNRYCFANCSDPSPDTETLTCLEAQLNCPCVNNLAWFIFFMAVLIVGMRLLCYRFLANFARPTLGGQVRDPASIHITGGRYLHPPQIIPMSCANDNNVSNSYSYSQFGQPPQAMTIVPRSFPIPMEESSRPQVVGNEPNLSPPPEYVPPPPYNECVAKDVPIHKLKD